MKTSIRQYKKQKIRWREDSNPFTHSHVITLCIRMKKRINKSLFVCFFSFFFFSLFYIFSILVSLLRARFYSCSLAQRLNWACKCIEWKMWRSWKKKKINKLNRKRLTGKKSELNDYCYIRFHVMKNAYVFIKANEYGCVCELMSSLNWQNYKWKKKEAKERMPIVDGMLNFKSVRCVKYFLSTVRISSGDGDFKSKKRKTQLKKVHESLIPPLIRQFNFSFLICLFASQEMRWNTLTHTYTYTHA